MRAVPARWALPGILLVALVLRTIWPLADPPELLSWSTGEYTDPAWVVHGADGSDEVTVAGETRVSALENGRVTSFSFSPESVGIERANARALTGGTPEENARTIVDILEGARGARRDAVVLNAGFVIAVAGHADSVQDGVRIAAASIDDGRARDVLEHLRAVTNELALT